MGLNRRRQWDSKWDYIEVANEVFLTKPNLIGYFYVIPFVKLQFATIRLSGMLQLRIYGPTIEYTLGDAWTYLSPLLPGQQLLQSPSMSSTAGFFFLSQKQMTVFSPKNVSMYFFQLPSSQCQFWRLEPLTSRHTDILMVLLNGRFLFLSLATVDNR